MDEKPFRGFKERPIVISGEDAEKFLEELNNPTPRTEEQEANLERIKQLMNESRISENFNDTKNFIKNDASKEQLQVLLSLIASKLNETSDD